MAYLLAFALFFFWGCSFDYGTVEPPAEEQPDIVMYDVEYVRVENGEPMVKFNAEKAEHYEKSRTMKLSNFSFTQFNQDEDKEDTSGFAGSGVINLDSKDVSLDGGVHVDVPSEDIEISASKLDWKDKPKHLNAGSQSEVFIERPDGTVIQGSGFSADLQSRSWEFSGGISGTYVHTEDSGDE